VCWIDLGLRSVPGGAAFLRVGAMAMLPKATPLERAAERSFRPAAEAAAKALEGYAMWLETRLRPKARGDFAIGRDAVDAWLKHKELLDHDAASLRAWGDEFYGETEAALNGAAMELGHQDWRGAVEALRGDHPTAETLVETYRGEMERSRLAVATAGLATIPYGEDLVVEAMPEFQRPTYPYAAYFGAGPFESSRRGRFCGTLPDARAHEKTRRERLE